MASLLCTRGKAGIKCLENTTPKEGEGDEINGKYNVHDVYGQARDAPDTRGINGTDSELCLLFGGM